MGLSAKDIKSRVQNKRNRKRSLESRNKNVDKQRSRDHAKKQRKRLEGIHAEAAAKKGTGTLPPSMKSEQGTDTSPPSIVLRAGTAPAQPESLRGKVSL